MVAVAACARGPHGRDEISVRVPSPLVRGAGCCGTSPRCGEPARWRLGAAHRPPKRGDGYRHTRPGGMLGPPLTRGDDRDVADSRACRDGSTFRCGCRVLRRSGKYRDGSSNPRGYRVAQRFGSGTECSNGSERGGADQRSGTGPRRLERSEPTPSNPSSPKRYTMLERSDGGLDARTIREASRMAVRSESRIDWAERSARVDKACGGVGGDRRRRGGYPPPNNTHDTQSPKS